MCFVTLAVGSVSVDEEEEAFAHANQLLLAGLGSEQRMVVPCAPPLPHRSLFQELLNSYPAMSASMGHPVEIGVTFVGRAQLASGCFVMAVEGCLIA